MGKVKKHVVKTDKISKVDGIMKLIKIVLETLIILIEVAKKFM